jgi:2-C-methyl-D-erythritol 4-phosphate cytidylyltransferase
MKNIALIPAAGSGARMGTATKKPYLLLNNRPVLYHTLAAFDRAPSIERIIIAVAPGEEACCETDVVRTFSFSKNITVIAGGDVRQESVRRLLEQVPEDASLVLIHDGARPLITVDLIERAIAETRTWQATVAAVPVKDTIQAVDADGFVQETLPREKLWSVQTPQTFSLPLIREAHAQALRDGFIGTDEGSLVERLGRPVKIIMGAYDNIKVTTPEDLLIAEALLKNREILNLKS